uniref:Carbohydrate sulfotransferase n=1 Tax=Plectus sambesii TaxID=2011161 RepID=A0A914VJ04_9BILA
MFELRLSHARLVLCLASTVFLLLYVITMFAEPFVKSTEDNANMTTTTEASNTVERYKPGAP